MYSFLIIIIVIVLIYNHCKYYFFKKKTFWATWLILKVKYFSILCYSISFCLLKKIIHGVAEESDLLQKWLTHWSKNMFEEYVLISLYTTVTKNWWLQTVKLTMKIWHIICHVRVTSGICSELWRQQTKINIFHIT